MSDPLDITPDMIEVFLSAARPQAAALEAGLREVAEAPALWPDKKAALCDISHNLKGQGASFGYPLVTQIGQSLNKLLKSLEPGDPRGLKVALAHAQALRTVLESGIRGTGGASGDSLVKRLQTLSEQAA